MGNYKNQWEEVHEQGRRVQGVLEACIWKLKSELEKAQRVLRESEERRQAPRGGKRVRPARTGRVG